ncbi:sensor domain-containing protein [Paenibacillus aestuarii]|uniref:EAL domain-containing protein n=1 Tax=Paenibacillus aestuarii TaxID=516965 RepID=A0ABW0K4D5_9BACL|nr:EAL domain-containing protein [Paenibacillus aestuarii]
MNIMDFNEKGQLYAKILDNARDAVLITDHQSRIICVNAIFTKITGYSEAEVLGKNPSFLNSEDQNRELYKQMWGTIEIEGFWQGELWNKKKSGDSFPVWLSITAILDKQNHVTNYVGIFSDCTERTQVNWQNHLHAKIIETASEGIMITGADQKIIFVNPAFTRTTGYEAAEVLGRTPGILRSGIQGPGFYAKMSKSLKEEGSWKGEIWNRRKDGKIYAEKLNINAVFDEHQRIVNYIASFSDITESKRSEEHLLSLAHHDLLTGLPNRAQLKVCLDNAMVKAQENNSIVALFFLDIDRFKVINDSMGHVFGDKLLKQVANRLVNYTRKEDTVARLGGDEFVVVSEDIESETQVNQLAQKLIQCFDSPFHVEHHELFISPSIGISMYPLHGQEYETLISSADLAMYEAKKTQRGLQLFNHEINESFQRKVVLEYELRKALEKKQLSVYFQPQLNIQSGAVLGMEALVRWQHEQLGFISPGEFIPIAEENGLICQIGEWVLREVSHHISLWQTEGLQVPSIAINISPREFINVGFVNTIQSIIKETAMNASNFVFEITESIGIDQLDGVIKKLNALKEIGIQVAIDDFGKGYSSLNYLKHLPIDILKIDKSFIDGINDDVNDYVIARAMIQVAHGMGMKVIAEGVETASQIEKLKQLECDIMQGFLISKPLPADLAASFLRNNDRMLH